MKERSRIGIQSLIGIAGLYAAAGCAEEDGGWALPNPHTDGGTQADTGIHTGKAADPECTPGKTQPCWPGPAALRGIGICKDGVQTCNGAGELGAWGDCVGAALGGKEVCHNTIDDDCDGKVDCDDPDCQPCEELNCSDGVDDDEDGLVDCADPDCTPRLEGCGPLTGTLPTPTRVPAIRRMRGRAVRRSTRS